MKSGGQTLTDLVRAGGPLNIWGELPTPCPCGCGGSAREVGRLVDGRKLLKDTGRQLGRGPGS
jgi:hypothetical protein